MTELEILTDGYGPTEGRLWSPDNQFTWRDALLGDVRGPASDGPRGDLSPDGSGIQGLAGRAQAGRSAAPTSVGLA